MIKYMYCATGLANLELWQIPAKVAFLNEYKLQFPQEELETKENYQDRITNIVKDTLTKLATDGITLHTDRLSNPTNHPTNSNKLLTIFDDSKVNNKLDAAYYCTQSWRGNNSVGTAFTIIDKTKAERKGFIFDIDP